jgi:hypothetical protein
MPRRPPRVLAAASAVLLAGVVGLWVRSYWVSDAVLFVRETGRITGGLSGDGSLCYLSTAADMEPGWHRLANPIDRRRGLARYFAERGGWWGFGFGYEHQAGGLGSVSIPLWLVAGLAGHPLAWVVGARRRPPPGHCQSCGYDLTANVSGRCPECGAAAEAAPVAAAERRA